MSDLSFIPPAKHLTAKSWAVLLFKNLDPARAVAAPPSVFHNIPPKNYECKLELVDSNLQLV